MASQGGLSQVEQVTTAVKMQLREQLIAWNFHKVDQASLASHWERKSLRWFSSASFLHITQLSHREYRAFCRRYSSIAISDALFSPSASVSTSVPPRFSRQTSNFAPTKSARAASLSGCTTALTAVETKCGAGQSWSQRTAQFSWITRLSNPNAL